MAFKAKQRPKVQLNTKITLDAHHNRAIESFMTEKQKQVDYEKNLREIRDKKEELLVKIKETELPDFKLQRQIWDLEEEEQLLERKLSLINNNQEEFDYILKTSRILNQYYNIIENEKTTTQEDASGGLEANNKSKTVYDWFENSKSSDTIRENLETGRKSLHLTFKPNALSSPICPNETAQIPVVLDDSKPAQQLRNKNDLYDKYMKLIDKNYIINTPQTINNSEIIDTCNSCKTEMLLGQNAGMMICPKCGTTEVIIIDSDKPSYKDPPKEMTSFCYKRINHLNEFLAQFQAKETTEIPEDVYKEILNEIKKERIKDMSLITPEKMRSLLRKIKRNDYYEHIPYIINQLNGLPAPVIAPEIEEVIRGMFKAIQVPFEKHCPSKRKNFLSYNYVMYKFFELLELDEYLKCFQLLKSRSKLYQQDIIWAKICQENQWAFYPSL